MLRGERLLTEGKVGEAKRVFEQALADDPNDPRAWLDLGLVHEATGDFASAEKAYRRATGLDRNFAEAFNNLGVLLREGGKLAEATTMLERAVALDPQLCCRPIQPRSRVRRAGKARRGRARVPRNDRSAPE